MTKLTFSPVGDYLLPDIALSDPPPELTAPLGKYALMHQRFLKEHRPILYNTLLLSEKLYPLLREIDEAARERARNGVSEEVILSELIYDMF